MIEAQFSQVIPNASSLAQPILSSVCLSRFYGSRIGCAEIEFSIWPGEVLGIVGESGSGKSTLLRCLAGLDSPTSGRVLIDDDSNRIDLYNLGIAQRRALMRKHLGIVHQNPRDGLRMKVSAGGNIAERLLDQGIRNYSAIRTKAKEWLNRVEIDPDRIDDMPMRFSGGMQQRLQIARVLISGPKLVFMDEPTGGLDVSVQAKLLDMIRNLVRQLNISVIVVTHDLAVARLLTDRLMVMKDGYVVETGLTDQVLDDPQHAYTQLLTSAILV